MSTQKHSGPMKHVVPLTDGWTLRHGADLLPAQVPGCVHTDLLAADRIPGPFIGQNELLVEWVARSDWQYDLALPAQQTAHERTDLAFDGLDTVAEIRLGDHVICQTANMHRGYRFDVTERQDAGADLSVRFTSAQSAAEAARERLGARLKAYPKPLSVLRKMACSFGWDWGPCLPTAGIWRPARLEHWSTARLARVRPLATVDGQGAAWRYGATWSGPRRARGRR